VANDWAAVLESVHQARELIPHVSAGNGVHRTVCVAARLADDDSVQRRREYSVPQVGVKKKYARVAFSAQAAQQRRKYLETLECVSGQQLSLVNGDDLVYIRELLDKWRGGRATKPRDVRVGGVRAQSPGERRRHDNIADSGQANNEESLGTSHADGCEATGGPAV